MNSPLDKYKLTDAIFSIMKKSYDLSSQKLYDALQDPNYAIDMLQNIEHDIVDKCLDAIKAITEDEDHA